MICDKCSKELGENEIGAYSDFPAGTGQSFCQSCYDEYRIACAEKSVAEENVEWVG